jgi:hypothetical protein
MLDDSGQNIVVCIMLATKCLTTAFPLGNFGSEKVFSGQKNNDKGSDMGLKEDVFPGLLILPLHSIEKT